MKENIVFDGNTLLLILAIKAVTDSVPLTTMSQFDDHFRHVLFSAFHATKFRIPYANTQQLLLRRETNFKAKIYARTKTQ